MGQWPGRKTHILRVRPGSLQPKRQPDRTQRSHRCDHSEPLIPMTAHTHYLWFETKQRQEIIDITDQVAEQLAKSGIREGFALVSAMHISASVFVNDHESGLWHDILHWLEHSIAPWDPGRY